jgi:4'-phosphopantetheinyl transferase
MTRPSVDNRRGLSPGETHVWIARLVDDDGVTLGLLPILDQEEQARAARFSFERDRVRFIQAHGIMRRILADYAGGDPATLSFARNRHGKPYLVPRTNGPDLQFNVSHSGNCSMLAVRLDHSIGIDVEHVRGLPKAVEIAQSYFTPTESRALAALQGAARRDAFFVLWTHKEAVVKALGIGLAANLGCIEFDLDSVQSPRLIAWHGDRSLAQRWSILGLAPAPGYVAAVASAHLIQSLILRNWSHPGPVTDASARTCHGYLYDSIP